MRSFMLVIVTVVIIGGLFFVYTMVQTSPPIAGPTKPPRVGVATRPAASDRPLVARDGGFPHPGESSQRSSDAPTGPPGGTARGDSSAPASPAPERIIGAGDNVWVKTFDSKTGRLSNEFRAARYEPRPDDTVDVTSPEARFYLADDTVLLLQADRGRVVIPSTTGQQETLRAGRGQSPTRGELYEVRLSLHPAADAPPVVVATMPNIVFDNDTFRLGTESYTDAAGNTVPAERVPITVRGQDYDFDGYGLTIRWNEVDRRLQLLEVNRGDRLIVKNPRALKLARADASPGSEEPIEVKWSGPLRVVPAKISRTLHRELYRAMLADDVRVWQAGSQIAGSDVMEVSFTLADQPKGASVQQPPVVVSLTGKPARVQFQGMTASAAVVSYDSTTGGAELRSSPENALVQLRDGVGRHILAQSLVYDGPSATATLNGPVRFDLPVEIGGQQKVMRAEARQDCVLSFDPAAAGGNLSLRAARFRGEVMIDHPQLRLGSGGLELTFDPTARPENPALSNVSASGGVHATLLGDQQASQTIECERLAMVTNSGADGQLVPRSLRAEGAVRVGTPQQQLSAGLLELSFAPKSDRPGSALIPALGEHAVASLLAEKSVRLRSADGTSIDAERVALEEQAGRRWLSLTGSPARLGEARGTLEAATIRLDPDGGDAVIVGGGRYRTVVAGPDGQPGSGQAATITWKDDLRLEAQSSRAQADGGVEIVAQRPDGTAVHGTAQRLELEFASAGPGERPGGPVAGRQLLAASLIGGVQLGSIKLNPDGTLLQRLHVFSERLQYLPDSGQIRIPAGGRMLVEDRRPPASPGVDPLVSPRGATAFQWTDQLRFTPAQGQAELIGDVLAVYVPDGDGARPMRVRADQISVEFADRNAPADNQPSQLRKVVATGNVRFNSDRLEFHAAHVEFRPPDDVLIARGTQRAPAVWLDEQGLSRGSFLELWLNTRTNESHLRDFRATVRR